MLRATVRKFGADQCTDLAGGLTYYGTLAVFPALLAFVSILGFFGDARAVSNTLLTLVVGLVPADALSALGGAIQSLTNAPAAGLGLAVGIVGALWSASGYVGALGRAMNRIYGVPEGRPIWKLRGITLGLTALGVVVMVIAAAVIALSGSIAQQLGALLGIAPTTVAVWDVAKWPVVVALVILLIAVLDYTAPNVKLPRVRWLSVGTIVTLLALAVASTGFAFYAANFAHYNATYGSIGGVIIFLLWMWIANLALLFGKELDAELERMRELRAGMPAEEALQLPPRDLRGIERRAKRSAKDVEFARRLRRRS